MFFLVSFVNDTNIEQHCSLFFFGAIVKCFLALVDV